MLWHPRSPIRDRTPIPATEPPGEVPRAVFLALEKIFKKFWE